jgi:hypothetical protein
VAATRAGAADRREAGFTDQLRLTAQRTEVQML